MKLDNPVKLWVFAARPWSLTAAFVPVGIGSLLAVAQGYPLLWGRFAVTMVAGILIQVATNFFNTYGDFKSGVDSEQHADDITLVKGLLKPQQVYRAGWLTLVVVVALGIILTAWCGWQLLVFGVLGVIGACMYTTSPCPLKYSARGPLAVFFLMGPLMVMPSYFIQTGEITAFSFWVSIPIACLVTGIMHANDIRDIENDRGCKIRTVSMILGRRRALWMLAWLYIVAFIASGVLGFFLHGYWLVFLLVPMACKILKPAFGEGEAAHRQINALCPLTAKFHFLLGLLIMAGLVLSRWI